MKHFVVSQFLAGMILLLVVAVPVSADDLASITSISPVAGYADDSVTVTITGVNFTTTKGEVRLEMSGETDIVANTISSWGTDTIVCKFIIDEDAETGDWDLIVTRGYDDLELELSDAFTITAPMTLTSISPTTGEVDDDVDFSITGTGLSDVEEVYLYNEDYENITADDIDAASTKVTGTFDLSDAADDEYEVCVVNSYDIVECDLSFDIATIESGSIAVSSSPSGASIYVDGTAYGTTPDTVDDLVEGSHKLVLKKTGYDEWGKIVTVEADEETEVDADLNQVTTIPTTVRTTEPASVYTTIRSTTVKTTRASTIAIPTTWADTVETTAEASPLDPVVIIGAVGLGLAGVAFRKQ
ncbi:MAG: PEGA domain-containing protein [Methanoregula sp.]|jgi:hypothetical protein